MVKPPRRHVDWTSPLALKPTLKHFDRALTELLQLYEECSSPSFDRMSRLVEDHMPSGRHRGHLGFSRSHFCDDRFCQRGDAVEHLPRI